MKSLFYLILIIFFISCQRIKKLRASNLVWLIFWSSGQIFVDQESVNWFIYWHLLPSYLSFVFWHWFCYRQYRQTDRFKNRSYILIITVFLIFIHSFNHSLLFNWNFYHLSLFLCIMSASQTEQNGFNETLMSKFPQRR